MMKQSAQVRVGSHSFTRPNLSARAVRVRVPSAKAPAIIRWSLLIFIFSFAFDAIAIEFFSGAFSLTRIAGFLFLMCCLVYPSRCFSHPSRALWCFLGYAGVYIFMGFIVPNDMPSLSLSQPFTLIQLLIVFWLLSRLLREEQLARQALLTLSLAAVFLALGALVGIPGFAANDTQAVTGVNAQRMSAMNMGEGSAAILMALAAIILLGLSLNRHVQRQWYRVLLLPLILPLLVFTVYTGSRTGIVAFIIGASVYLLPHRQSKRKMVSLLWAFMGIIIIIYLSISDPVASSRWNKTLSEGSTSGRDKIYSAAVEMVSERPVFGWGPIAALEELAKRESSLTGEVRGSRRATHNLFLHLLVEVGLFGTIPFLIGLWVCIKGAWKARIGPLSVLPFALMTTTLAYSLAQTALHQKHTWFVFAVAIAAATSSVTAVTTKFRSRQKVGLLHTSSKIHS